MRTCKRCEAEKDECEFYRIRGRIKGTCKTCDIADRTERRKLDPTINQRRAKQAKAIYGKNPEKFKKRVKAWTEANRDKIAANKRRAWLSRKYGLTTAGFDSMVEAQGGVCAICSTDAPGGVHNTFHVDHEHIVGYESLAAPEKRKWLRGILCTRCNLRLGHLEDMVSWGGLASLDKDLLPPWTVRAISYLTAWYSRPEAVHIQNGIVNGRFQYMDTKDDVRGSLALSDNLIVDLETGIAFVGEVGETPTWEAVREIVSP